MENKTIAILEELWRYEKTTKYTDKEIRNALEEAIQALKRTEKTEETEDGENIFEEYYPYLGGIETSKEDLIRHFKGFLDFPEHCGIFIVRWKENDNFVCRYTLNEYIEMINTKVEDD